MKVVLIEANRVMRQMIRSMLTSWVAATVLDQPVAEVMELADPGECLDLLERECPDLVILADADLHDQEGQALPAAIRRASPQARILVLGRSGRVPMADGCLPYPFGARRLASEIATIKKSGERGNRAQPPGSSEKVPADVRPAVSDAGWETTESGRN